MTKNDNEINTEGGTETECDAATEAAAAGARLAQ